jgi:hypothetical protein
MSAREELAILKQQELGILKRQELAILRARELLEESRRSIEEGKKTNATYRALLWSTFAMFAWCGAEFASQTESLTQMGS